MSDRFDVAIVGAGIVGLATAMAIARQRERSIIVLEAEPTVGTHQTSHNSGVIHSGIYYRPGSLKSRLCRQGAAAMYEFCAQRGVPVERCGKVIIATRPEELPRLEELESRARAGGVEGVRRLCPDAVRELEPHAAGLAGLHIPATGITDFAHAAREMAGVVQEHGGVVRTASGIIGAVREAGQWVLSTRTGEVRCQVLVNCAGLHCDRVARLCGHHADIRIIPFRGEYCDLTPRGAALVRNLIYPVPLPRMPFLGVHFTRMIHGGVEAGPNAVLALARHGYNWRIVSLRECGGWFFSRAFWRMSRRHWHVAVPEVLRSFSRRLLLRDLQRLVPALRLDDLQPGSDGAGSGRCRAGVRAQAVDVKGQLVDDFRITTGPGALHVLNAPSPAATASIAIGQHIAACLGRL